MLNSRNMVLFWALLCLVVIAVLIGRYYSPHEKGNPNISSPQPINQKQEDTKVVKQAPNPVLGPTSNSPAILAKKKAERWTTLPPKVEERLYENARRVADPKRTNTSKKERDAILRDIFDLKNSDVRQYLIDGLNTPPDMLYTWETGNKSDSILFAKGTEGILWLLKNYDEYTSFGRGALSGGLTKFSSYYVVLHGNPMDKDQFIPLFPELDQALDEIFFVFLDDKSQLPYEVTGEFGGITSTDNTHRICDVAYHSFYDFECYLSEKSSELAELKESFRNTSYEDRDKRIELLKQAYKSTSYAEYCKTGRNAFGKEMISMAMMHNGTISPEMAKAKMEFLKKLENEIANLKTKVANGQPPKEFNEDH